MFLCQLIQTTQLTMTDKFSKDDRFTPIDFFSKLHDNYKFTLDPAGHPLAPVSQIIGNFLTPENDGLIQSWGENIVFLNCPYSNIRPWIEKCWKENEAGTPEILCLVPAWTDRKWWQDLVEPRRDNTRSPILATNFLGRMNFGTPDEPNGSKKWKSQPQFGMCLLHWSQEF